MLDLLLHVGVVADQTPDVLHLRPFPFGSAHATPGRSLTAVLAAPRAPHDVAVVAGFVPQRLTLLVSLPALEEPFTQLHPPTEDGPQVAVEGIETPNGRRIVLFTTCDISLKEANAILTDAGFRGVMRLDETRRVDQIPVLGTGKTDYKVLRRMVAETVEA